MKLVINFVRMGPMNHCRRHLPVPIYILAAILPLTLVIFFSHRWSKQPAASLEPVDLIRTRALPLNEPADLQPIFDRLSAVNYVLLGESSHGTAEYYTWRRLISQTLISDYQFSAVVVEGDWAPLYRLNLYVKHLDPKPADARAVLSGFDRWPTWLWANEEFLVFVDWLKTHNASLPPQQRVGIYGKDLYGPGQSQAQVLDFLDRHQPDHAAWARDHYGCLDPFIADYQLYVASLADNSTPSCQASVEAVFDYFTDHANSYQTRVAEEFFSAQQNALVVKNSELHYRSQLEPGAASWNHRVRHMKTTVNRLTQAYGPAAKLILWAHNTHLGDARATDMARFGQINIGQLLREKHGPDQVFALGFGTYTGQVVAAPSWGSPLQIMTVPPALAGSYEDLFFQSGVGDSILFFDSPEELAPLMQMTGHRAKGVVYDPKLDRQQNYVLTDLPSRYDAFVFLSKTSPLTPLN
jgi:erythromycin esterase